MKWICAFCREPKEERPAIEHQHLFPGCGGSCGYFSRVCVKCADPKVSGQSFTTPAIAEKIFAKDHEIYHQTTPPRPDGAPHIGGPRKKPDKE
jgi:hypothetical protein